MHIGERLVVFSIGSATAILFYVSSTLAFNGGPPPDAVNLAVLLAHPSEYKDKTVSFYAFGVFEFEESSLYLSRLHAELADTASQIFLADKEDHSDLNGRIVRVKGVFRVTDTHPRGYLNSIEWIVAVRKVRIFPEKEEGPKEVLLPPE